MKRMFKNGRYANVAATMALVLATGGTSYAAYTLPHNSVGTAQIRSLAVKNSDIGWNAVTTGKVRDGTLRAQDFASGQLPQGPQGPAGQATAFARFDGAGNVVGGSPSPNEGLGAADVQHAGAGVYCVRNLPFAPRSAMVTVDADGPSIGAPFVAAVAVQSGAFLAGCDPYHQQARITITALSPSPTAADHGFYVWFEK